MLCRLYRQVCVLNRRHLPFYLRNFCEELLQPSFRVAYTKIKSKDEVDKIYLTNFHQKWMHYCSGIQQIEIKKTKPGQHILQDLDLDQRVYSLIDKAVDFDEEAL